MERKHSGLFNHQEARLERSFYRALHELQRLRKEREANSALVCQTPPGEDVAQVPDLPSKENKDIHPPPDPEIPTPTPESIKNPDPPAAERPIL